MSPVSPVSSRPAAFITGAAAGIGRATALRLARAGWFVGLYDLDADAVEFRCGMLASLADSLTPDRAEAVGG